MEFADVSPPTPEVRHRMGGGLMRGGGGFQGGGEYRLGVVSQTDDGNDGIYYTVY